MAKSKTPEPRRGVLSGRRWLGVVAFVLLLAHFTPLLSPHTTIQWDAVDVHYSLQRYFSEQAKSGQLPHWTPYVFSGFPFLSDPQVGAWYPLNWSFFLLGVTPGAIQGELALHALLALCGAFLLLRRLTGHDAGAMVGALSYGLGGFFAAHSSHVGMFQGAALLPWLLYSFERGLEAAPLRWFALAGGVTGMVILAGHMQTAVYAFGALVLFAGWRVSEKRQALKAALAGVTAAALLGGALAGIVIVPGMELTAESIRAGADYGKQVEGVLDPGALATLIYANAAGVLAGQYHGPTDVTQSYFYSGILLLPLAALALKRRTAKVLAVLLVLLPMWYMLGPGAGLYRLGGALPLLHKLRAPVHLWFAAAMALAILAAMGVGEAEVRWKKPWLGTALVVVFAADLLIHNSWYNPLAYGRASFDEVYGKGEKVLRTKIRPTMPPNFRLHMGEKVGLFGSLNSPLQAKVETTYGYNPLELAAYQDYRAAAARNELLIDGLSAAEVVHLNTENITGNEGVLPRAYFAPDVVDVKSREESRAKLENLNPAQTALVEGAHEPVQQDPQAQVLGVEAREQRVAVRYRASSPSLLKLTNAFYPGWEARVGGRETKVLRVDHALSGVVVPAGEREVIFQYKPTRFPAAAGVSVGALVLIVLASVLGQRRKRPADSGVVA
ncbi:MAG: hypothetical protein HZB13_10550 [Acidobacteria bacterium]|nr:hypothetical protein [Acidobacteriota bacterium]